MASPLSLSLSLFLHLSSSISQSQLFLWNKDIKNSLGIQWPLKFLYVCYFTQVVLHTLYGLVVKKDTYFGQYLKSNNSPLSISIVLWSQEWKASNIVKIQVRIKSQNKSYCIQSKMKYDSICIYSGFKFGWYICFHIKFQRNINLSYEFVGVSLIYFFVYV